LTTAQQFKIGRKAAEIGIALVLRLYKKKYPNLDKLSEPTARRPKHQYVKELKKRVMIRMILMSCQQRKEGDHYC